MSVRAAAAACVFTIEVVPERERVRVTLSGELDLATSGQVERDVHALLERGFEDIVVDLRELTFIDSSGIHALLECRRSARQLGARLAVILAPGIVTRAVELCRVRDQLDVVSAP
jgi:anti-sigma B factor antagonist